MNGPSDKEREELINDQLSSKDSMAASSKNAHGFSRISAATRGETSIKRAALINMTFRYTAALLQMVYSIALARILSPSDFGVVAIAQVFVTFLALFQDMGLGAAIVQRQDLDGKDISRIFGFTSLVAVILGCALLLGGIPMAALYGEPILTGICSVLSAATFLSTLNTVPNALLMKSKRFFVVGLRQVTCVVLASAIGILSALAGAGPYAIAVYSVVNAGLAFAWNWMTNRVVPSYRGMMESVRKVFGYSAWLFGFNLVTYFSRNTDNLLVGYFFGTADLGNYSKAYQLMKYPQTYLTSVVTSVLHPMLAERQDDIEYVWSVYMKLTKALSLIGVFMSVLCFFCANEVVLILYGDSWTQTAACLRLLSISVWSQMVCGASGPMFQVLNRTREQFVRGLLIAVCVVAATLVGVAGGSVETVAAAVGLSFLVPFVLLLPTLVRRSFGRSIAEFLLAFAPDAAIAVGLSLVLSLFKWPDTKNPFLLMGSKLVVASLAYIALLVAFRQAKWLMVLLPSRISKRLSGQSAK